MQRPFAPGATRDVVSTHKVESDGRRSPNTTMVLYMPVYVPAFTCVSSFTLTTTQTPHKHRKGKE